LLGTPQPGYNEREGELGSLRRSLAEADGKCREKIVATEQYWAREIAEVKKDRSGRITALEMALLEKLQDKQAMGRQIIEAEKCAMEAEAGFKIMSASVTGYRDALIWIRNRASDESPHGPGHVVTEILRKAKAILEGKSNQIHQRPTVRDVLFPQDLNQEMEACGHCKHYQHIGVSVRGNCPIVGQIVSQNNVCDKFELGKKSQNG